MEELLALRAEIRMLQVFQQAFSMFAITAMGICCLLGLTKDYKAAALAAAFFAVSWSFAMARNDFLIHRIANYAREAEAQAKTEGYESWKAKHSRTAVAMPLLDITSFAVIFFLFVVSLYQAGQVGLTGRYTYGLHLSFSIILFLAGLVMIPGAVWLAKKS